MKYLVMLTALIALLSCGSDTNLISPDPSADMGQSTETNGLSVVEDPLVVPPEDMVEPPNEDPPQIRVVIPPEDIEVIVVPPNEDPPQVRVVVPPEVIEAVVVPPNGDPPIRIVVRVIEPPEVPEVQNEDPPMDQ